MTVYRKIFKCRTAGSKEKGDLRPEIVGRVPAGINLAVLEYNEAEGWCIVEFYCSDHPLLGNLAKGLADLEKLKQDPSIIEELTTHPASPKIIGGFAIAEWMHEQIDEEKKEVVVKGKRYKYVRRDPDPRIGVVIDEG
ncbi:MAG: hypothetical protein QXK47_04050 [Candidatus Bathyarchaeia archaeon]